MHKAMASRVRATILFATETGRSETLAQDLGALFSCAFNPKVATSAYVWGSLGRVTVIALFLDISEPRDILCNSVIEGEMCVPGFPTNPVDRLFIVFQETQSEKQVPNDAKSPSCSRGMLLSFVEHLLYGVWG